MTTRVAHKTHAIMASLGQPDQLSQDIQSIKQHPLYPLLRVLAKQCNASTSNFGSTSTIDDSEDVSVVEITQLLSLANAMDASGNNNDVDRIMLDAIYVLRIHLAELKEVDQLTYVFVDKFKELIRTRLHEQHELLFGQSGDSDDECLGSAADLLNGYTIHHVNGSLQIPLNNITQMDNTSTFCINNNQSLRATPIQGPIVRSQPSPSSSDCSSEHNSSHGKSNGGEFNFQGSRRSGLPKAATEILRTWLFRHASNPYPNDSEKDELAEATNLSSAQINNWFINARRRILQPVLTSSGLVETSPNNSDKSKSDQQ